MGSVMRNLQLIRFPLTSLSCAKTFFKHVPQCTKLSAKVCFKHKSNATNAIEPDNLHLKSLIDCTDSTTEAVMLKDLMILEDFVNDKEEEAIIKEMHPYLRKKKYEFDHWDDAIHGFREMEICDWSEENKKTIDRIRVTAFHSVAQQLKFVHVLDLSEKGCIKPHIDSVRFCGSTIAGLSLLSSAVMRFVNDIDKSQYADVLLKPRSLYIMRNKVRYEYTHEILDAKSSTFKTIPVPRSRRISVICRCEPES